MLLASGLLFSTLVAGGQQSTVHGAPNTSASAVVLVNSRSVGYADFERYIRPYLDNFGVAYSTVDVATTSLPPDLASRALIIIGHRALDVAHVDVDATEQARIAAAVQSGTGLVSFDSEAASPAYDFVQTVFGFGSSTSRAVSSIEITSSVPASGSYIIEAQAPGAIHELRAPINPLGVVPTADSSVLATAGGQPLVVSHVYGAGRGVQWTSYAWMHADVFGYIAGLDDVVWRSLVWAARKPFVLRALPPLVTMRVDDGLGGTPNLPDFGYVPIANRYGFKPLVGLFLDTISDSEARALKTLIVGQSMTASVHSRTDETFFYFDHGACRNLPDSTVTSNFASADAFFARWNIRPSSVVIGHYYELGGNVFDKLRAQGAEFLVSAARPGEGYTCGSSYYGGPYRHDEVPGGNGDAYAFAFADWVTIPGRADLNGKFFNVITEIRDDAGYEWFPNNDVEGTTRRGVNQLKRALDSMVLATLFTHEYYIADTTTEHFDTSVAAISQQIASYQPIYLTYDDAARYVRALATSRLTGAEYDAGTRMLTATFSGESDVPTRYSVYTDAGGAIQRSFVQVPAFSGGYTHSTRFDVPTPPPTPTPEPISCPCSIWPATAMPSVANQPDSNAVELGVKFRADVSGTVSGVRFYKGPANTGTHVGSLWTGSGQLLARATFSNETVSGWQQVSFATPVSIAANTTYVIS